VDVGTELEVMDPDEAGRQQLCLRKTGEPGRGALSRTLGKDS